MIELEIVEADLVTRLTLNHDRWGESDEIVKYFRAIGISARNYYVERPTRKSKREILRSANYLKEYMDNINRFKKEGWVQQ